MRGARPSERRDLAVGRSPGPGSSSRGAATASALLVGSLLALAGVVLPGPARAQEDFRNADLDRPLLTEDAYPVKLREWEVELGARGRLGEGGAGSGATGVAELKTGLFLNGEVGVGIEGAVEDVGPGSEAGLEGASVHLLYNANRETWGRPAFAGRVEVESPGAGELGREKWGAEVRGIATRSVGRLRLHANAGYRVASVADGDDVWAAGLALDYPIGLFSRLLMGDVFVEVPVDAGRTRVWLEVGTRWQLTNLSVLDLGLATRLDEWEAGRANVELVAGISRVFGIPGLVNVPPYPDPSIY